MDGYNWDIPNYFTGSSDEDFWDNFTLEEPLEPKRVREVIRDYNVINAAQQWERRIFFKILDAAIMFMSIPDGYKGTGRPSIPLQEKLKICCIKQYNMRGARRSVYDVETARNNGYLFVPKISNNYFNRINDYMKDEELTPYLQQLIHVLSEPYAGLEKNFAVDGSGMKTSYGKYSYRYIRKDKKEKRKYIGLHLITGGNSKIVPYAIVSKGYKHDNNFFKPLVRETLKLFEIKEIYGDSAFFDDSNQKFCHAHGIKEYIKPKKNTILHKFGKEIWNNSIDRYMKDLHLGENRRYTLRNNVESCFFMVKSVFLDFLRHKTFSGRVNEALTRVACHNIRVLVYGYFKKEIKFPFGDV